MSNGNIMDMLPKRLCWTYPCGLETEWILHVTKTNPLVYHYEYGVHKIPGELAIELYDEEIFNPMTIETKYTVDDTLYFIRDGRIQSGKVISVRSMTDNSGTSIRYWFNGVPGDFDLPENRVSDSLEGLSKLLIENFRK